MFTHNFEGGHICKRLRLFWLENLVKRGRQYNWQNILYIGPLRIFHVVEDMIYILYVISIDEKLGWSPPQKCMGLDGGYQDTDSVFYFLPGIQIDHVIPLIL